MLSIGVSILVGEYLLQIGRGIGLCRRILNDSMNKEPYEIQTSSRRAGLADHGNAIRKVGHRVTRRQLRVSCLTLQQVVRESCDVQAEGGEIRGLRGIHDERLRGLFDDGNARLDVNPNAIGMQELLPS